MISKLFKRSKEQIVDLDNATVSSSGPVLNILFKEVHIATLFRDNSGYCLIYKPQFMETGLVPFHASVVGEVELPEAGRVYHSKELWPAFKARIPSSERDDYLDLLSKNNLNEHSDPLDILGAVGRVSISKPWRLEIVKKTA